MTDALDAIAIEKRQEVSAEMHAWELVQALMSAVAALPPCPARTEAQALLRKIDAGELPEPTPYIMPPYPHHTDVDEDISQ
jgi:hypothetical protein